MANQEIQKDHKTPKTLSDKFQNKKQRPLSLPPSMHPEGPKRRLEK